MTEEIKQPKNNSEKIPVKKEILDEEKELEIKTPEDLSRLVEERIADAELIANGLDSSGKNRLKEIENSIKISEGELDDSNVKAGMEKINSRAKGLLETLKAKLKMAAVVGMATMAFSGAGDFEKAKGGEENNSETKIESLKKLKQSVRTEEERQAIENYEKALEEAQESIREIDEKARMYEVKKRAAQN